jgi:hypothetical protein
MKRTLIIIFSLLAMNIFTSLVKAQGWRGLVPLKSTCEDTKRSLSITSCEPSHQTLMVDNESVEIAFTENICQKAFGRFWNVPVGSLMYVARRLKEPIPLSEVIPDVTRCEEGRSDIVEQRLYTCNEEGLWLNVYDGMVREITYVPRLKDNYLQCAQKKDSPKGRRLRRGKSHYTQLTTHSTGARIALLPCARLGSIRRFGAPG